MESGGSEEGGEGTYVIRYTMIRHHCSQCHITVYFCTSNNHNAVFIYRVRGLPKKAARLHMSANTQLSGTLAPVSLYKKSEIERLSASFTPFGF